MLLTSPLMVTLRNLLVFTTSATPGSLRYDRFGELSDLERAISKLRDAADLTPHGHPHKPTSFNILGKALTVLVSSTSGN
jgi:hypothetical protein